MGDAGGGSGKASAPRKFAAGDRQVSFCKQRSGRPGVWIKRVVRDENSGEMVVKAELCPEQGKISDLLYHPESIVEEDEAVLRKCRADNPQPKEK